MTKDVAKEWYATNAKQILATLEQKKDSLHDLDDTELNKRYLKALRYFESSGKETKNSSVFIDSSKNKPTNTNRSVLANISQNKKRITETLVNNEEFYEYLPENIKSLFKAENKYQLNTKEYSSKSTEELKELQQELQAANKILKTLDKQKKNSIETIENLKQKMQKQTDALRKEKDKNKLLEARLKNEQSEKKNLRDQLNAGIVHQTSIVHHEFDFTNDTKPNDLITTLLNTTWTKTRLSTVQGVISNKEEVIANGKIFFEENTESLLDADISEIEQAVEWFLTARMNNATDNDYKKFIAIKGYFLAWVLAYSRSGEIFANLNSNLKLKIDKAIKDMASVSGTFLHKYRRNAIPNFIKRERSPLCGLQTIGKIIR